MTGFQFELLLFRKSTMVVAQILQGLSYKASSILSPIHFGLCPPFFTLYELRTFLVKICILSDDVHF